MSDLSTVIDVLASKYPPIDVHQYVYGTAGFRMNADLLDSIAFKVTLLAILRSFSHGGSTVGVMITASHNPPHDNGVKVVEPLGEMLDPKWEQVATDLANASNNNNELLNLVTSLWSQYYKGSSTRAHLVLGRDTRDSGPRLVGICRDTLLQFSEFVQFEDAGEITTPQLHYITRCYNDPSFGEPSVEGYHKKLGATLSKLKQLNHFESFNRIIIDGANGIGSVQLEMFLKLNSCYNLNWDVEIVNDNVKDPQALNVDCGADYVKTNQKEPMGSHLQSKLGASFDGDADRIVFYFMENGHFHLLDGDRIAILLANFISVLIKHLDGLEINMGIIQTAYANGASTSYIQDKLNLPVICTKTGVKHLHHAATTFDVGVYFEANGHGTVLFKPDFLNALSELPASGPRDTLLLLADLINQTVGDSLSDLLAVIVALSYLNNTPLDWYHMYDDLPNKLYKVLVKDRFAFKTTDAERKLIEPRGFQSQIDHLVQTIDQSQGRSFVRASGTEDAVRVYAEASTVGLCKKLGEAVVELVKTSSS